MCDPGSVTQANQLRQRMRLARGGWQRAQVTLELRLEFGLRHGIQYLIPETLHGLGQPHRLDNGALRLECLQRCLFDGIYLGVAAAEIRDGAQAHALERWRTWRINCRHEAVCPRWLPQGRRVAWILRGDGIEHNGQIPY